MIDTGRKYSRCNAILCARYKNICIRIWLTDKNPVKIVQKKYITAVILWQPRNTQNKIKKLPQDLKVPLFRTILYILGLNFSWGTNAEAYIG